MKIFQQNVQSLVLNRSSIEYYINNNSFDICFFSEIFTIDDSNPSNRLINFDLFCKLRSDGYGGCAIAVRKGIRVSKISFSTDLDILILRTKNLRTNLVLVSVYLVVNL